MKIKINAQSMDGNCFGRYINSKQNEVRIDTYPGGELVLICKDEFLAEAVKDLLNAAVVEVKVNE